MQPLINYLQNQFNIILPLSFTNLLLLYGEKDKYMNMSAGALFKNYTLIVRHPHNPVNVLSLDSADHTQNTQSLTTEEEEEEVFSK